MLKSRATAGAAAILVVLFTLILLAAILVVSSRLSLSSLQTNADQASTLEAQYAAESNMNYARSVLSDLQNMMSKPSADSGSGDAPYLFVPPNISLATVRQDAANFCDNGAFSTNVPSYALSDLLPDPNSSYTPTWCALGETTGAGAAGVLAKYVTPLAYTDNLTATEAATAKADPASFWTDIFTNPQNRLTKAGAASFRLQPLGVLNMGNNRYRFFVGVGDMASKGEKSGATRVLTARNNVGQGVWWFELGAGNLLNSVLHTDHHRSKAGATNIVPQINFVNQRFYGSVHTNESFLFQRGARTQFIGSGKLDRNGNPIQYKVTSAGCDNLPRLGVTPPDGFECTKTPKYYSSASSTPRRGTNAQLRANLDGETDLVFDLNGDGRAEANSIDFNANYVALPTNSANQSAAARGRDSEGRPLSDGSMGLTLTGDVNSLTLYAGDSSGRPLTTYSSGKWQEPSPAYQFIGVQQCENSTQREVTQEEYNQTPEQGRNFIRSRLGTITYYSKVICETTNYRIDKEGNMALSQNGRWAFAGKFNGVIYGNQINNVRGPERRFNPAIGREDLSAAPPALASFSGITIAAEDDINILNDLTMSDPPCRMEVRECSNVNKGKNMLGIYSQRGDINIASTAPNDLMIHSALMSSLGEVGVIGFDQGNAKGDVHLRGALVESWYGAFGTVRGTTPSTGYGRDFTYDERYRDGIKPPFWPESPKWETLIPAKGTRGLANLIITNQQASDFK